MEGKRNLVHFVTEINLHMQPLSVKTKTKQRQWFI